ncbi:MAG: phosphatase PAP2 family protein [Patescibacteria group bacterium]
MINQILLLDTFLFLAINHLPHSFISDVTAQCLSGIGEWGLVWFFFAIFLFIREEKRDHLFFLPVFISGFSSWAVSEYLIKFIISRPRPSIGMGAIIVGGGAYGYSFPSTHTTIAFALAYVLSSVEPRLRGWFYLLAIFIGFSRIYLGVHYPLDVLTGALVGWAIGVLSLRLNSFLLTRIKRMK